VTVVNTKKVKITTLPVSRWQDYKEIRLRALEKEPSSFCMAYDKEAAKSDEKWKQSLQDALDGKSWLYFASYDDKLVGMVGGFGDELDWKNHRVYLWGMYVDEEYREKGLARLLANKLLFEIAKRDDVFVVCLEVNPEQVAAVNFYESLGFRRVGVETHVFCDGLPHEVLVMERVMH
jgi:ribosomal protein S18 acetylase RimI-like enzyme